jgi:hypothetical protein
MKKCSKCGKEYEDRFNFCQKCGVKLDSVEEVADKMSEHSKVEVHESDTSKVNEVGLKRLYLLIASLVGGVIVLLIGIKLLLTYNSISRSSDGFDALYNAFGTIKTCVIFYYIVFFIDLACIAGFVYRYVKMNDKRKSSLLVLGSIGVSEVIALTLLSTMMNLSKVITAVNGLMNGTGSLWNLGTSAASLSTNTTSIKVSLILWVIAEIATVALSGYSMYLEKTGKELSVGELQNSGNGIVEFLKEYTKTEKGKKNTLIVGGVCGALIVCLAGTGIYNAVKKTPVDLMSSCKVDFSGFDGNGYATGGYNYGCEPDYDKTNQNISTFMNTVSYTLDKSENLSNGDTITLTASYSEETAKSSKVKVTESTKTFKVKGLTKVYKTWKSIPEKTRKQILEKVQAKVEKKAKKYSGYYFLDEVITVDSISNVATYYSYDKDYGTGEVIPVFKVSITDNHDGEIDKIDLYYYTTITVDGDFKASDKNAFNEYMDYYEKDEDESEEDILDDIMYYNDVNEDNLVH